MRTCLLLLLLSTFLQAQEEIQIHPAATWVLDPTQHPARILKMHYVAASKMWYQVRQDGFVLSGKIEQNRWIPDSLQIQALPGIGSIDHVVFSPYQPTHVTIVRQESQLFHLDLEKKQLIAASMRDAIPDYRVQSILHHPDGATILLAASTGRIQQWNLQQNQFTSYPTSISPVRWQTIRTLHAQDSDHFYSIGKEDGEWLRWSWKDLSAKPTKVAQLFLGRIHQSWYAADSQTLAVLGEESRSQNSGELPTQLLIRRFNGSNAGTWIYPAIPGSELTSLTDGPKDSLLIGGTNWLKVDLGAAGFPSKSALPILNSDHVEMVQQQWCALGNHRTTYKLDATATFTVDKPPMKAIVSAAKIDWWGQSILLQEQPKAKADLQLDLGEDEAEAEELPLLATNNPWVYHLIQGKKTIRVFRPESGNWDSRKVWSHVVWNDGDLRYLFLGHALGIDVYQLTQKGDAQWLRTVPTPDATILSMQIQAKSRLLLAGTAAGSLNAYRVDLLADANDYPGIPLESLQQVQSYRLDQQPLWRLSINANQGATLWRPWKAGAWLHHQEKSHGLIEIRWGTKQVHELHRPAMLSSDSKIRDWVRQSLEGASLNELVP